MNKFRLNQILEILTFPYTDMGLIRKDYLAEREDAYCAFLDSTKIFNTKGREEYSKKYEQAHRRFGSYLCSCCTGLPKSMDDMLLIGEKFFPHGKIIEKMGNKGGGVERRDLVAECYVDNIFWIANSLLASRDGVVSIRTWKNESEKLFHEDILGSYGVFDKVEIWNNLSRIVTPDLFISAFVCLNGSGVEVLHGQGANISLADGLLMRILDKGMAETHLHINVSSDYLLLWEKTMNLAVWRDAISYQGNKFDQHDYMLFHVSVYRYITAYYLETSVGESYEGFLQEKFAEVVTCMCCMGDNEWRTREERLVCYEKLENKWKKYMSFPDTAEIKERDILYGTIYQEYESLATCAEYVFLVRSLDYIKRTWDIGFIKLFLQYVRIKNNYFSKIFQRNAVQGLNWFQNYFAQASGSFKRWMTDERRWNYILQTQINVKALKKLEFRISVDTDIKFYAPNDELAQMELQKQIIKGIGSFLRNYKRYIHGRREAPTIGIVLHFNKRKSLDNVSGFFCWRLIDDARLYSTQHKIALRRKYVNIARAIAVIRNKIPYLDEYLVGLDVASDENAAEPWLFSPAYNEVRDCHHTDLVKVLREDGEKKIYKRIQNIGLTYHVGEDYRHILSGLRHIDEVVEKYNYRSCDRIGHGIALGVDVDYWAGNNQNVLIPLGEYLDNLLWVWGLVVENRYELPISAYALEGRILQTASKIFGHMAGITVHVLYRAYQKKFGQDFTEGFRQYHKKLLESEVSLPEQSREVCLCREYDNCAAELWDSFKIVCTYFCPVYEERYNQVMWLETTREDVKLLKALQGYMMDKIQRKGIYIETNPTSNLAIGEIESLYSHYVVNLNTLADAKTERNIMVTINSDDPMVFNTNVENELAYMYHGLISAGYDSKTVLEWIDQVRQYGMDSSFIKRIKTVEEMEKDIDLIEKGIESFLKQ